MPVAREILEPAVKAPALCVRIGLVVHPARDIERPLSGVRRWASIRGVPVFQIPIAGQERHVADVCTASECDLIVAIGGDGTTLAAIHAGAAAGRPVLGVACGSLGALTLVLPDRVEAALQRLSEGEWRPRMLPALDVAQDDARLLSAFNDIAIVRAGEGQVMVSAELDGVLFSRFAGDGCIVSTPIGSSAYTIAAGGPVLAPGSDGFVLTALPAHGGFRPPLVIGPDSTLRLEVTPGHGGVRFEADGQLADTRPAPLTISLRRAAATFVGFHDDEPLITGLRRRQIIIDSPRILADDARQRGRVNC
jgi:NAD+ kinase